MIQVDQTLVAKIADLSSLELTPAEGLEYEKKLQDIINYIGVLESVVEDAAAVNQEVFFEQEDIVQASQVGEMVLAATKHRVGTAFKVPKIIEK